MDVQTGSPSNTGHFRHGTMREPRTGPMQNLTRYLSAATYLDKKLCDAVLKEYVYEAHRAIVPSHGYDLEPVVRHARQARLMRIIRDVVLVAMWIALWAVAPLIALPYFLIFGYGTLLTRVPWRRLSGWRRLGLAVLAPWPLFWLLSLVAFGLVSAYLIPVGFLTTGATYGSAGLGVALLLTVVLPLSLGLPAVTLVHLHLVLRRLGRDLGPGARGPGPDPGGGRFHHALAHVRAAQNGNITMYAGDNPFIGTGHPHSPDARVWSIVLELDRKASGLLGTSTALDKPADAAPVDPLVMYERIREKLHEMRDEGRAAGDGRRPLPPNERISALITEWHVTARGRCVQRPRPVDGLTAATYSGHPLIDPSGRVPYSTATQEAIEAAVRHPQAGIRCFQRVSIGAQGQAITTPSGGVVAPAEDQEAALSAFVHLAVEGRMLYGHFAATVLPPVRPAFKIVDELPAWDGAKLLGKTIVMGFPSVFSAPLFAPYRLASALWRIVRETLATDVGPDPVTDLVHDYGSRISVRELAADFDFHDYVQEIDVDKYVKLIERRVNEALLDYLTECGVDVSAYREQVGAILNQGVIMTGGTVNGQVAAGGRVDQRQSGGRPGGGRPGGGGSGGINP
ncbi:hypothetical protein [Actinomadura livida]|uniref:Uncharacterized protein n=1 Tax=Actinomadura livida TaxID=79909 RepID=A0A7W7MVS2_9ACTN|nr:MULTISPECIES: hypothetical protein [Actinomadura]MBB4772838.1 hypothetical protein [Actinomadura catellatispora]GGU13089.1 hypothetical protein GCM10010208_42530 [Actinomadura livida]